MAQHFRNSYGLKAYTAEELKKARRAGFKLHKPNKPKGGLRSTEAVRSFVDRFNTWVDKLKTAANQHTLALKEKEYVKGFQASLGSLTGPRLKSVSGVRKSPKKKSPAKRKGSKKRRR